MEAVVTALAEQHAELAALLEGLDDDDWRRPSRCEGWTVADVVLHLAQTDEMALASVAGRYGAVLAEMTAGLAPAGSADEGADLMVARERGAPPDTVFARWRAGTAALTGALRTCDPRARAPWVAGDLSARTLATTRLAEAWIHTGDVFHAFGPPPAPTDRLWHVARLAWRTVPYSFTRAGRVLTGPVAFDLTGPSGDRWTFEPDDASAVTVVRGTAADLCAVASRRVAPDETGLSGDGPDAEAVLELVRTWA
jgi:uncharacterized protein (TIGR03084 family)